MDAGIPALILTQSLLPSTLILAISTCKSEGLSVYLKVFKMKQNANNFKFRVLPLKLDPNWDQIGIPSTYVKKVVLLLKLPLPVKVLKLGIRLLVTEGEVLLWVSLAKREEKHLCQSIFQLQVVMSLPKVCTKYEKHQCYTFPQILTLNSTLRR